jgi:ketosteroid isomerase-like protein
MLVSEYSFPRGGETMSDGREGARTISQENLEALQRGYAHFIATGDFLDDVMHPDFVWDMSTFRGWPERQTYPGVDGARRFMTDWLAAWEDWELEVDGFVPGEEAVVAVVHQRGRSKATGLEAEMDFAMVWTFRDGKQFRMNMYASREEALEAAGLVG